MSQSDDPSPPNAEGAKPSAWTEPLFFKRWKLGRVLVRLVVWGHVGTLVLILLALALLDSALTPTRVRRALVALVAEQTGGRLELGQIEIGLFSGVRLHEVSYYPPLFGDTRGIAGGGGVTKEPLLQLKEFRFNYSTKQLTAGYFHLSALQLVDPDIKLVKSGGHFNFESILAFRAANLAASAKPQPPPEEPAKKSGDLIPIDPRRISLPIRLLLNNIGVENLHLELDMDEDKDANQPKQHISLTGLTFDLGAHWFRRDSDFWFALLSPAERPLKILIDKADGLGKRPRRALVLEQPLMLRVDILELSRLNIDLVTKATKFSTPALNYNDLASDVRVRLGLTEDLKGIKIEGINVDLANALSYELGGLVGVSDGSLSRFDLHLNQDLQVDLAEIGKFSRPFVPGLEAEGEIALEDFTIEGSLEPSKLAAVATEGGQLPNVSMRLWLRDVKGGLPGLGLEMAPLSTEISLQVAPAVASNSSQIDLGVDFDLPRLLFKKDSGLGPVTAGVHGLTTKVVGRVLWPDKVVPIFKVDVEADRVVAFGPKIAKVDVPLVVDIDAQGRQDLSRLALTTNAELSGLAAFSAMVDCQNACQQLKANVDANVASFTKIHAILTSMADTLKLGVFMPEKMQGKADFKLVARAHLPDPRTTKTDELIKRADLKFDVKADVLGMGVTLPFDSLKLSEGETQVTLTGDLHDQRFGFQQKFSKLSLVHPKPDAPPMPVEIGQFNFTTTVTNQLPSPIDLNKVPDLLRGVGTDVVSRLNIGQVNVGGTLPRPITNFSFDTKIHQFGLSDIKIQDLNIKVPDFGAALSMTADTKVDQEFLPTNMKLNLKSTVTHAGDEGLAEGMSTRGKASFELSMNSKNMRNMAVNGAAKFDHFSVSIPAKEPGKSAAFIVEDVDGEIPFRQDLLLPDLKEIKKRAAEKKLEVKKAVVTATDKGAKVDKAANVVPEIAVTDEDSGRQRPKINTEDTLVTKAMDQFLKKNDTSMPKDANMMAMVDYSAIKPFYPDRRPISIKRIDVANLEVTNMELDMELRQSLFTLNQFLMDFLGGKIEGDFKVAFDTTEADPTKIPKKLWTSVHMTRLDTRKLIERFPNLRGKAASWDIFASPYIDATIHILFDISSSDISGDVEISSIGKEQLKMMLFYVDPYEQNPTIRDIRGALNIGEVRRVSIPLRNGEVGMDVDVRVLAAPIPTPKLQRFPIRQILQNFKDQAKAG